MNLSEEELVKHVAFREPYEEHPDSRVEGELSAVRWAVYKTTLCPGEPWDDIAHEALLKNKTDEEVLEMIARARLEEEI